MPLLLTLANVVLQSAMLVNQPRPFGEGRLALSLRMVDDDFLVREQALLPIKGAGDDLLGIVKGRGGGGGDEMGHGRDAVLPRRYWRAVYSLVEFRNCRVIPFLVRDIEERPHVGVVSQLKLGPYRNADALTTFGDAVVPEVLRHLKTKRVVEVSTRQIELYARVLEVCYSLSDDEHRLSDIISLVRTTRERSPNKENLDRLVGQLEKMKRGERPQF